MPELSGRLRPVGRVAILVSRYNEAVTSRLLEGALACTDAAQIPRGDVDVIWVAGAFELPVAAAAAARTGRYACLVALGVVIRGETPHFEYVAEGTTRGLGQVSVESGLPVGFGVLTVDTLDQAVERAGGAAGNKGYEAAAAAIEAADVIARLRASHAAD
jgi:6,7-dimethyl-8-ribityllumazine synthase